MNYRHTRCESEYIYLAAYDIIHKYKFFPAGLPTAEATGPRLRGQPLRVLFCWPGIAPRSWLRRFAPTRNFVAGCGVVLDQGNIAGTKKEVARRPRFRRFAPTVDSSLAPGNNPTPIPIPSARRRRQRRSGMENQQVRTKSMLWGHINALIISLALSGNVRNQKHG